MIKRILMSLCVSCAFIGFVHAQTFHAIIFCNTIDRLIGNSMKVEFDNMKSQVQTWEEAIDYDQDNHFLDGSTCTRANLKAIIDQMDVEPNDIILTFYGGHGSHAENDEADPWPQYLMNSGFENQGNWVPMATLQKWVQAKNARLSIIISNCCNGIQEATTKKPLWAMGGNYTYLSDANADNYKKLFASKGLIMSTSSKLGELSWCAGSGGLYTCDFVDVMNKVGSGSVSPNWNSVLSEAYKLTSAQDIVDERGQHYKQHPYYKVYATDRPVPPPTVNPPKSSDGLAQALLNLVNKKTDQSTRLAMIPQIINNYMSGFSKVMTIGTDMQTVVDYEDPEDFLRRICLSPYIKQVNIISKDGAYLKVHELRTR